MELDMSLEEMGALVIMAVTFTAMAAGSLWFAWGLIRMQMPAIQIRYFVAMAVFLLVIGASMVYFVRQPPENEEQAAMVVLGVLGLAIVGVIAYAFYIRRRFANRLVRWEFSEASDDLLPDRDDEDEPPRA